MDPRPRISWSDLRGRTVGVWGLGVEGAANLRRLQSMGVVPVLVDDHPPRDGGDGVEAQATDAGGLESLLECSVVIKTPGIPRSRPEVARLTAAGVTVVGGLGLWMEEAPRDRVCCITGTKGKSTTTAVAGHLLERLGHRCLMGGNIGAPPWDPDVGGDFDYWVVETSSFQATDLATSPPTVAVTSLGPDHLDWHGSLDAYIVDKLSICTLPGAELTIADAESDLLRSHAGRLGPHVRWVSAGDPSLDGPWAQQLGLLGAHNHRNALIARAVLQALGVAEASDEGALAEAAQGFVGLGSRLRQVTVIEGVELVDDSLSTTVLPALAALDAFEGRRVALLVGGYDRGIDYRPLAAAITRRSAPTAVLTMPDSGPRIGAAVAALAGTSGHERSGGGATEVIECPDLEGAVATGFDWARPDGVVLLSPAAPSFGRFHDYHERSGAFAAAVATLPRARP